MATFRWRFTLDPCFNPSVEHIDSRTGPESAEESDWSRYGVTGPLYDECDAPEIDESEIARFMADATTNTESNSVRDRLRRFRKWRQFILEREQNEVELWQCELTTEFKNLSEFRIAHRRALMHALKENCFHGFALASMIDGFPFKDDVDGPPVDSELLRRTWQGPPAATLQEVIWIGKMVLTYRQWHDEFQALVSASYPER